MTSQVVVPDDPPKNDDEEDDIEKYEIYRLDYETNNANDDANSDNDDDDETANNNQQVLARAAGGEMLQPGDHVYMECTLYQHHGIVLQIIISNNNNNNNNNNNTAEQQPTILIAEFTNVALANDNNNNGNVWQSSSTASAATSTTTGVTGGLRLVYETNVKQWHKVKYQASWLEHWTWRPGTCSRATPLPTADILWRVQFLWQRRHDDTVVPRYHLWTSNCETVAVWCRTGQWTTLQASRAMVLTSTITTAAAAAAAVGLGPVAFVTSSAAALTTLWQAQQMAETCQTMERRLNQEFQWYTLGKRPTEFAFFEHHEPIKPL